MSQPAWHPVRVAAVAPAAEGLVTLALDVGGTPLAGTHRAPGQYVRLLLPEAGEGVFAIASAPARDRARWEFLLKTGSALPDALAALPAGAQVQASAPEGHGFPLGEARGSDLLLFATGSGISAIRSVIESVRAERERFGGVTLYFGARTPEAFAYRDELEHWEAAGIRVVRTVSQPGASGWQGLTGYVQAHLGEVRTEGAHAFLCGQADMVEGVTRALASRGMPRERLHLNY